MQRDRPNALSRPTSCGKLKVYYYLMMVSGVGGTASLASFRQVFGVFPDGDDDDDDHEDDDYDDDDDDDE